ncbi:HYR domain-containing protein [Hyalangium sp.]|uniref:HYR domain-containing protein n=1 Tax=Hyalangium sp. TaxID=2028555 RepID=UPI002D59D2FE|nr:HYR domain-containing protein [Hyalangium sp.]HYH98277.1 HYR domain-containing protein [Hyalangium sp.]
MNHGRDSRETQAQRSLVFVALVGLTLGSACDVPGGAEELNDRNTDNLEGVCEVVPPFTPNFEPELQWAWTGSSVLPEFNQVMMTPAVADVNQDGTPDIIFSSFRDIPNDDFDWREGVLRAISGSDGHDLWAVTDPAHRIKGAASIAVGNIDGDPMVEICGIPMNGRGIICYENDGTFKFRSAEDAFDYNEWGGPSLADLDGDGTVEILDGNRVYSNTGALKWVGSDGMGGAQHTGPVSFSADIDGDGKQEVVNGRSVYRFDGSLKCANTNVPQGLSAVGNFDGDIKGEIVVSGHGKVSLLDDDCSLKWSVNIPGGCVNGCGGGPTLADVDNDGLPEIGVAGENAFTVFETDGSVKWTSAIQDWSSGKAGATAFDFDHDGRIELVLADEVSLRIYNGATGAVRWQTRHSSGTTHENPVIADVDGDFAADLVVATNDLAYPPYHGIRVYHDSQEGWAHTRKIWNQHAYAVTNVNNDGSIPAHPASHWQQPNLNTFRSNVAGYLGDVSYAASDLVVVASSVSLACGEEGTLLLSARVSNQGSSAVAAGLKVAFYRGNPASGGTLIGVATLVDAIAPGASVLASVTSGALSGGSVELFVVADDDGTGTDRETECDEANNSVSTTVELTCEPPPPANQPPVALCKDVTVSADAQCGASASVDNGSHDPDSQPGPFSISESPPGTFSLGSHTVTLTANDGAATAQCVGHVTVVDTSKPAVSCPASRTIESCAPNGAQVSFQTPATDNCGPAQVSCSHASGSTFPVGQTAVTCSASDGSGNSESCGFNVTVQGDSTPPAITCPISVDASISLGEISIIVQFAVSATDSCGPAQVTCSHPPGSLFIPGLTPVTCTATDPSGNTASCNFGVRVSLDLSLP